MATYHLDLNGIDLREFFGTINKEDLSPGRMILLERKEERLTLLLERGITTLQALIDAVKTPRKMALFAEETSLPGEYLTILRRQALSWLPKPVALDRFPDVSGTLLAALADAGFKNGLHLYNVITLIQGEAGRGRIQRTSIEALASQIGCEDRIDELVRLVAMADLTRIIGVGPVFAEIFFDNGVGSVAELAQQESDDLYTRIVEALRSTDYRGPEVTRWDISSCIGFAQRLVGR